MIRVFLVEDEQLLLRELQETFPWQEMGCQVVGSATSLQEARHAMASAPFDILVTDIKLPDGSGIDLVVETTPAAAIVITGFQEIRFAQAALRAGAIDFLLKPLDDEEMHGAVQRAIEQVRPGDGTRGTTPGNNPWRHPLVRRAFQFITTNYHRDVSLKEAAEDLRISESHLADVFKHETGRTFVQVLTTCRMEEARRLLDDPRNQVAEVARQCGYRDPGYFARVFRRYWGSSPRAFRHKR